MIFLIVFILAAIWAASRGNKKFIIFFMAFYPILPDYFSIELGGGMPLLKASRILLLILLLCVCFRNKKILAVDYLFCSKNFGKRVLCFKLI